MIQLQHQNQSQSRTAGRAQSPLTALLVVFLFAWAALAETKTIVVQAALPSKEPSYVSTSRFTAAILNSTNIYRSEHNASALTWNSTLAKFASNYLSSVNSGTTCKFAHSGGPYGENLAMGYPNATTAVEAWGDERDKYNFKKGGFGEDTGHFTQLVWKNTTTVGCGRWWCGSSGWYLVCEYWPRGNVQGQYQEEVGARVKGDDGGSNSDSDGDGDGEIIEDSSASAMVANAWYLGWALVLGIGIVVA